jgi:O-antigen ligase
MSPNKISILPNILTFIILLIFIKLIAHYSHIGFFDWIVYAIIPLLIFPLFLFFKMSVKYDKISIVLFIILLYLVINTSIKTQDIKLTIQALTITLSYLLLYTLLINIKKREKRKYSYLFFIVILVILLPFEHFKTTSRISGLLGNPNLTAHFTLMILPMILYFQRNNKYLQFLLLVITFIVLIKTGSRSALLAYGLVIIFFIFYKYNYVRTTFLNNIFIIILTLVLTLFIIDLAKIIIQTDLVSQFLGNSRLAYTGDNHRYEIWMNAINLWKENMITGVGMGVKFHNETHQDSALGFHNTFLNILTTGGIIGLILFIYLLVLFIKNNSNNNEVSKYKMLQLVVFVSLSYSATTFFVINFHYYLLFIFQTLIECPIFKYKNFLSKKETI